MNNDIFIRFKEILNIIIIYIDEAHAIDEWPIGNSAGVINFKHKSLKDRIGYALKFKKENKVNIPVYIDNFENDFKNIYKSWPFRAIIIKDEKLVYNSTPVESEYNIIEIYDFLDKCD